MLNSKLCDGERRNSVVRGFYEAYESWQRDGMTETERALKYYLSKDSRCKRRIRENGLFKQVFDAACYNATKGRPVERFSVVDLVPEVLKTLSPQERQRYLNKYPLLKEKMEKGE